jgi:hypothetical protein
VDLGEVLLGRLQPFRGALREPMCRSILFQHLDIFRPDRFRAESREAGKPEDGIAAGSGLMV